MTYAELQAEVFRRLEELQSDPEFWELSEIKQSLNEGWQELALHTEWYREEFMFALQDGITYYDLRDWSPDEIIAVRAVWNETVQRWLTPSSTLNLEQNYRRWETASMQADQFFLRGNFTLGIFGKPTVGTTSSDFITVMATAVPPPLLPDDYVIPHPERFCECEILYALYDLKAQEGEVKIALGLWEKYLAEAERFKQWSVNAVNNAIQRGLREASL